jgi:hypothetical protein
MKSLIKAIKTSIKQKNVNSAMRMMMTTINQKQKETLKRK